MTLARLTIGGWISKLLRTETFMFALIFAVALFIANVIVLPAFGQPRYYAANLASLAPAALIAMASTPSILSGGGGIDVSVGPLMGVLGIVYVVYLQPHGLGSPEFSIPIVILLGAGVGLFNGTLVAVLRYQPVIATLCMYFILGGVGEAIIPTAKFAQPSWIDRLAESYGPVPGGLVAIGVPLLLWLFLRNRTSFVRTLLAIGSNDAAALTAGIDVRRVRLVAYTMGGALTGVAALSLTSLTRDGDPSIGAQYTLVALAGVTLGGTMLGGGRGGLIGAVCGAGCIYLIQNLLSNLGVNSFWDQVVYGAVLVAAIVLSKRLATSRG